MPQLVLPLASSSSQTQVSPDYYTEEQRMVLLEEHQHLQYNKRLTNLVTNAGEHDTMFQSAIVGRSGDRSSSGRDVMQP